MSKQPRSQILVAAKAALTDRIPFEAFIEKLSPKDRLNVTRHLEAADAAEGGNHHSDLWRRLSAALVTLAPHFAKTDGQQRVRFFVPDGPYRMQVFAMEDLRDGVISIYCGDALEEAVSSGLVTLRKNPDHEPGQPEEFSLEGGQLLAIQRLGNDTHVPAPFYKDMLGWNRKALCIRLPVTANAKQAEAVELICAMSLVRAGKTADAAKPAAKAAAPKSTSKTASAKRSG